MLQAPSLESHPGWKLHSLTGKTSNPLQGSEQCVPLAFHYLTFIAFCHLAKVTQQVVGAGMQTPDPGPSHCSTHLVPKTTEPEELPFHACLWS